MCLAGDPWDKQPGEWALAETYQILRDSPWSPGKTRVEISMYTRRVDPYRTNREVKAPEGTLDGEVTKVAWWWESGSPVLWWSSKTVRLAQQRLKQLRDPKAPRTLLHAEELPDFVLLVEGAEPLRILRDDAENLRETVFLELPNGMALDVTQVRFHEGEKGGEDYVAFHFPRQVEDRPTITPDTGPVIFHCKATARTSRPGQPNALSIRATFEPRKMRAAGQPDL